MKKIISALLIVSIMLTMTITTFAEADTYPAPPVVANMTYWVKFNEWDSSTDLYKTPKTWLIMSENPIKVVENQIDMQYDAFYTNGSATDRAKINCYYYNTTSGTWTASAGTTGIQSTYTQYTDMYVDNQPFKPEDIIASSHELRQLDRATLTDIGAYQWGTPKSFDYNMDITDGDGNRIYMEFDTLPTYGGVGTDTVKLYYTGNIKYDDGMIIPVQNQLFRVKTFHSKNFTITDGSGRTVMLLKSGAYIKLKSYADKDTGLVTMDSWSGSAHIIYYADNASDGIQNFENKYDFGPYSIYSIQVKSGLVAFKTFNPSLYTSTGYTLENPTTPSETGGDSVDPYQYEEEKPDRGQYEATVFGDMSYALDMLTWYVKQPFVFLVRLLADLVIFLTTIVTETANVVILVSKLFAFLPPPIQSIIGGIITISAIITVYKLFKK